MDIKESFGQNLKNLRREHKMTQLQVADYLGLQVLAYGAYERGNRSPSFENLCKLADLFRVSVDELLNRKSDEFVISKNFWQSADSYQVQTMPDDTVHLILPKYFDENATINEEGQITYKTYKHHVVAFATKEAFVKFTKHVMDKNAETTKTNCRNESLKALELFERQNISKGIPKENLPFFETHQIVPPTPTV